MTWPATFSASDVLTAAEMNAIVAMGQAWSTYTPTLTNVTKGNGTLVGRYLQPGGDSKIVDFVVQLTFGSTTAVTAGINLTLPVTAKLSTGMQFNALGHDDSASTDYLLVGVQTSTSAFSVRAMPTSAGTGLIGTGATVPFTWATSDVLTISGRYEAA